MQRLARLTRPRSASGFTLIELMVVLTLIMVLAGMAVAQYRYAVLRTQEAVLSEDLFRMRDAIDQYYADKAKYPASLEALVTDGYLRVIPKDPITKSTETWQTVPSEPDPANPTADLGIVDIKSGAPGTSLDGRPYLEF
jgi:general secretion pathway protein G